MSSGAVDTVEPVVAADFKRGGRGTDRPPGRSDIGVALIFILPALVGFLGGILTEGEEKYIGNLLPTPPNQL